MKEEIWAPAKGFEKYYEVSNLGRVRRRSSFIHRGKSRDYTCFWTGRVLKEKNCSIKPGIQPYKQVSLNVDGKRYYCSIHRLVAGTFIPNPENKAEVNHKNGDKADNRAENLEWVSSSQNKHHRIYELKRGRIKSVRCIETGEEFITITEASKHINRSLSCICACLKKPSRTAGGYHWEEI